MDTSKLEVLLQVIIPHCYQVGEVVVFVTDEIAIAQNRGKILLVVLIVLCFRPSLTW